MSPTTKTKNGSGTARPATRPATAGGGSAPVLTPEMVISDLETGGGSADDAPMLQPPGSSSAGLAAMAGIEGVTATTSAKVGGLWTNNAQANAWAYLNGIGWRRLGPANVGGHHALLQLARLARDSGLTIQCEDDGSVIHNIYIW